MSDQCSIKKYERQITLCLDLFLKTHACEFAWFRKQITLKDGDEDAFSGCSKPLERKRFLDHYEALQKAYRREIICCTI